MGSASAIVGVSRVSASGGGGASARSAAGDGGTPSSARAGIRTGLTTKPGELFERSDNDSAPPKKRVASDTVRSAERGLLSCEPVDSAKHASTVAPVNRCTTFDVRLA